MKDEAKKKSNKENKEGIKEITKKFSMDITNLLNNSTDAVKIERGNFPLIFITHFSTFITHFPAFQPYYLFKKNVFKDANFIKVIIRKENVAKSEPHNNFSRRFFFYFYIKLK